MAKDKWMICPACQGEGKCVNPSIDCNGVSLEKFDEDPDFREAYFDGVYDVICAACDGAGKIKESRMDELAQAAADRRLAFMEDGNYADLAGCGDYRFGG